MRQPTASQDRHAIGERFRLFQIVGREDDGAAGCDHRADDPPHRLARLDVEADGRLVEEEQGRPAADRERELDLALLPSRQLRIGPMGEGLGAREREHIRVGSGSG